MSGASPRPTTATVVCALGMHRSGTSLVARMLNLLGVHLGPEALVSRTGEDNPTGYWEHPSFVEINEAILTRFGGQWDAPPALAADWPRDPLIADLRERARQLLADTFAAEPLWGWKDPRTCLTLPFWQNLVGPMRYVMCIRNPRAVAASLTRRNALSVEEADWLWLAHTQASLAETSGQPRMFVFYEDLLTDWPAELHRMAAFIGRPDRAGDPRVHDAVGSFLEAQLCHHRSSMEDLVGDARISLPTKGLYVALKDHASRRNPTAGETPGLDRAARTAHHDTTIAGLRSQRDRLAAEAVILADEASARLRELEAALRELQEIHTSRAWRFVKFSRGVMAALFPPGTRRRDFVNAIGRRPA